VEDFPSNSEKTRRRPDREEPKQIERVVQGKVVRRKKSVGRRFKELLIGDRPEDIWEYIVGEVMVPTLKTMFQDAVNISLERSMWGESGPPRGRGYGRRGVGDGGFVSYNRYSRAGRDDPRDRDRREISRRSRANFDFDEIILSTRVEAEEVIERMYDIVSRYDVVTVADLYEMIGIDPEYTENKWGWEDLRGSRAIRVSGGYLLDLPRPEPIRDR